MDIEEDDCQENEYQHEVALIKKLDCKNIKCRQFLTRSFRKLDKLVNKKRNYTLTQSHQTIIDSIIDYAQVIKPYSKQEMFEKGPNASKSYHDQFFAHRRCFKAKVIIDGDIIIDDSINQQHFQTEYQKSIFKNGNFNLTLQSEPNTEIVYTTNGEHPMLTQSQNKFIVPNRHTETFQPPQHLNVIVRNPQRIESHLTTIIVKENRNGEQSTSSQGMQNWGIVRPANNYILDESKEMSESFKNIDNSSFLQN